MSELVAFDQTNSRHIAAAKQLPFSYFSLPLYLADNAYVWQRNGEAIIAALKTEDPREPQALFPPKQSENLHDIAIRFASRQDSEAIAKTTQILFEQPNVTEFFYRTNDFISPIGALAKKIQSFVSQSDFVVSHACPKDEILAFSNAWRYQRNHEVNVLMESEHSFMSALDNLETQGIRQVYVHVSGELAGLAWGIEHWSGNWVGLHMKVLYQFRDLGRFLLHERAKLFANHAMFTLGATTHDSSLASFRRELGPVEERRYSFLLLGNSL